MAEHPAYERRIADGKSRIVHLKGVKALKETLATYLSSMGSFFALCDANGDGTIDRGELQRAVLALGLPGDFPEAVLRRVADEVYSEFDADGSESISYHAVLPLRPPRRARQERAGWGSSRS